MTTTSSAPFLRPTCMHVIIIGPVQDFFVITSSSKRTALSFWKSCSLRQQVQPLLSWFSRLRVSPCLYLIDKLQDHFETRHVVYSVSHFVYEFVEFVIFLGRRQSSILSNKPLNKLDVKASLLSAVKAGAGESPPLSQIKKTQQMLLCDLEKFQDEGLNLEGVQGGAKHENVWHIPSNAAARVMLIS